MSYRLVWVPDEVEQVGTVSFRPAAPADEHEAALLLRLSAAAWISQGCPRELTIDMTILAEPPLIAGSPS